MLLRVGVGVGLVVVVPVVVLVDGGEHDVVEHDTQRRSVPANDSLALRIERRGRRSRANDEKRTVGVQMRGLPRR